MFLNRHLLGYVNTYFYMPIIFYIAPCRKVYQVCILRASAGMIWLVRLNQRLHKPKKIGKKEDNTTNLPKLSYSWLKYCTGAGRSPRSAFALACLPHLLDWFSGTVVQPRWFIEILSKGSDSSYIWVGLDMFHLLILSPWKRAICLYIKEIKSLLNAKAFFALGIFIHRTYECGVQMLCIVEDWKIKWSNLSKNWILHGVYFSFLNYLGNALSSYNFFIIKLFNCPKKQTNTWLWLYIY